MNTNYLEALKNAFSSFPVIVEINPNGKILVTSQDNECSTWFFLSSLDGGDYGYEGFTENDAKRFSQAICTA